MTYGVIFDCDGVLVDSEKLSCGAAVVTLNELGIKTTLEEVQQFIGRANHEFLCYYEERDGIKLDFVTLSTAIEGNYYRMAEQLEPMPGIERLLQDLIANKVPIAVASSGEHEKIRFSLEKTGLAKYFSVICSAVDVPKGKPEPDLFLYAADKLGLAPEQCYVFEDSLFGVMGGKQAGIMTIGYTSSFPETALREAGANRVIADFAAVKVTAEGLEIE
ncbi:MAG TPA: HAD family phosphatase [Bacillota bacterium]|nr:HAD family phosphatase [Bacillota bacterium]